MEYAYVNNRGVSSESLIRGVLLLVVAAVVAVVGMSMLESLQATDSFSIGAFSTANASSETSSALSSITSNFGIIGTIIVSVFLLTLIVGVGSIYSRVTSDDDEEEDDEDDECGEECPSISKTTTRKKMIRIEDENKQKQISKKIKKMSETQEDDFVVEDY